MLQPEKEEIRQKHDIFIMNRDATSFIRSLKFVFLVSLTTLAPETFKM